MSYIIIMRKKAPDRSGLIREERADNTGWTFLTNHAHVLLSIAEKPEVVMRDVANNVGITERAVQRIVSDLEKAGYIQIIRRGRQNRYKVRTNMNLRHPIERHRHVSDLIALLIGSSRQ